MAKDKLRLKNTPKEFLLDELINSIFLIEGFYPELSKPVKINHHDNGDIEFECFDQPSPFERIGDD